MDIEEHVMLAAEYNVRNYIALLKEDYLDIMTGLIMKRRHDLDLSELIEMEKQKAKHGG
jgi:hypothetical protein